jgi:hypothetical protein
MAETAPDPARSYGREQPDKEAGMGRLDNNVGATPEKRPDQSSDAVHNQQDPQRQINGEDTEPMGWDQAPTDIHDPEQKRHPRKEGKGGTP